MFLLLHVIKFGGQIDARRHEGRPKFSVSLSNCQYEPRSLEAAVPKAGRMA